MKLSPQLVGATVVTAIAWSVTGAVMSHGDPAKFVQALDFWWLFGWVWLILAQPRAGGSDDDNTPRFNTDGMPMLGATDVEGNPYGSDSSSHWE